MNEKLQKIYKCIIEGQMGSSAELVQDALDSGFDPSEVLNNGMIIAMREVGRLYEAGEYFVPEMLVAARTMQNGLAILKPLLVESDIEPAGTVAIGTAKGDLHDIGKNLVAMMLEGAGYEVTDLGTNVDPQDFLKAAKEGAQVIGMSALLTTTMNSMKVVIKEMEDNGLRSQVKIIIGGAPVTSDFAEEIGADAFATDASSAVKIVNELLA